MNLEEFSQRLQHFRDVFKAWAAGVMGFITCKGSPCLEGARSSSTHLSCDTSKTLNGDDRLASLAVFSLVLVPA